MHITEKHVGLECLTRGGSRGKVERVIVDTCTDFPVEVRFSAGSMLRYTESGKYYLSGVCQEDLIWIENPTDKAMAHLDSVDYFRKCMGGV